MKAVVKDVMSIHPISVPETTTVKRLAAMLRESGVSGFPVLDRDGRVLGVVSEADVLAKEALADGPEGIRKAIAGLVHRGELRKAAGIISQVIPRLCEPSWYSVIVRNGVVTVQGTSETPAIGQNVRTGIRRVDGVVTVRDRLAGPQVK
jgi:CBS domain-containing protein